MALPATCGHPTGHPSCRVMWRACAIHGGTRILFTVNSDDVNKEENDISRNICIKYLQIVKHVLCYL